MVGGYVPTKLRVTAEQECLGSAAVRVVYRIQGARNHAIHEFDVDRVYVDDPTKYFSIRKPTLFRSFSVTTNIMHKRDRLTVVL